MSIETLTVRQREVWPLLADGMSNKQIGRTLGISAATVKYHTSMLFARLGVSTRLQAALKWKERR